MSCLNLHPWAAVRALSLACCAAAALVLSTPVSAQPAGPDQRTRVVTLGTQGGPLFNSKRAQPANAVLVDGAIYLVDAGNGVARQLVLAGLDPRRVGQVFITHNHDDHNADWGTLAGLQWSLAVQRPFQVFGPAGTEAMREGFLRYFRPNAQIRSAETKLPGRLEDKLVAKDIEPGLVYQDERVRVSAMEVCHYHFDAATPPEGGPHKSYAYRFETRDRIIVFSGDTGACAPLAEFARGADLLVHEVVDLPAIEAAIRVAGLPASLATSAMRHMREDHTTAEDVGRLAAKAGVKRLVLTHLVPGFSDASTAALASDVRKHFSGPVDVAEDLMSF